MKRILASSLLGLLVPYFASALWHSFDKVSIQKQLDRSHFSPYRYDARVAKYAGSSSDIQNFDDIKKIPLSGEPYHDLCFSPHFRLYRKGVLHPYPSSPPHAARVKPHPLFPNDYPAITVDSSSPGHSGFRIDGFSFAPAANGQNSGLVVNVTYFAQDEFSVIFQDQGVIDPTNTREMQKVQFEAAPVFAARIELAAFGYDGSLIEFILDDVRITWGEATDPDNVLEALESLEAPVLPWQKRVGSRTVIEEQDFLNFDDAEVGLPLRFYHNLFFSEHFHALSLPSQSRSPPNILFAAPYSPGPSAYSTIQVPKGTDRRFYLHSFWVARGQNTNDSTTLTVKLSYYIGSANVYTSSGRVFFDGSGQMSFFQEDLDWVVSAERVTIRVQDKGVEVPFVLDDIKVVWD